MILHDRCSIWYDLAASFRGRRSTLDRWSRKNAKRIGTRVWAQHWSFHFWRKSRRSRSSLKTCQLKSRRLVSCLKLSSKKIEEVSSNSFIFKLAGKQIDRQLDLQEQGPLHYTTTTAKNANIVEGSLEVKLPTIWTDEKQSRAEAERRERLEERRSEEKESKKEDADARKGRKVAKHCVFPMICG